MSTQVEDQLLISFVKKGVSTSAVQIAELLDRGADPNATSDNGDSVLGLAVERDLVELAEVLLQNGANPNQRNELQKAHSPVTACGSPRMARLLIQYGARIADFPDDPYDGNLFPFKTHAWKLSKVEVSEVDFLRHARPKYGSTNPEKFLPNFWREQIRTNQSGFSAACDALGFDRSAETSPVWSFQRHGRTVTRLDDGQVVVVGGEHEDFYDDDFFIYNDVTVLSPSGQIDHFIYPREVFPPTDFHSATLVGERVFLIGSLGYPQDRIPNLTQVLALNLHDYSIERLETAGEQPGWIHGHSAVLEGKEIRVSGGQVLSKRKNSFVTLGGGKHYFLNTTTLVWRSQAQG